MKIEFGLPNGAGGMAAMQSAGYLRTALKTWADEYNISYTTSVVRHDHRAWVQVELTDRDYTLFALTFTYKGFMGYQQV